MRVYKEVYNLDMRVVMRRLNIYYNNSNKKHIVGKHNMYYIHKVMEWYKVEDYQAEWIVEHFVNNGFMYIMDEDIEEATKLGYIE